MVTGICLVTTEVTTLYAGETRAPASTITVCGTDATAGLELDSETTRPPAGATVFRLTVPVMVFPPVTLVWDKVTALGSKGLTVTVMGTATPL